MGPVRASLGPVLDLVLGLDLDLDLDLASIWPQTQYPVCTLLVPTCCHHPGYTHPTTRATGHSRTRRTPE